MEFSGGVSNSAIIKCFGCTNWVRIYVTECTSTSTGRESFSPQRWCFNCLSVVDELTNEAMKQFSDYPEGLAPWDNKEEETDENQPKEETGE